MVFETSLTVVSSGNQGLFDGQHRKERPCFRLQTVVYCDIGNCKRPVLMPLIGYGARLDRGSDPPAPVAGPEIRGLRRDPRGAGLGREPRAARAGPACSSGLARATRWLSCASTVWRGRCRTSRGDRTAEAKGAFFRSLTDPIDTSSPQGKFTLQVLGAAAEFERRPDPRTDTRPAGQRKNQRPGWRQSGPARPGSGGVAQRCGWRGRTATWNA